ncbi:uncharacterized protein Dwil_GK17057 [Drosophila willistoni]|uniref:Uncharacterized protein n=1 Tax=Drosophila willistoni TaxID=7260 RepID=B4MNG1_DROWI|nr:putative leucine-rich repeat-containing protein DDB_G0290503 [Drosophila willistoni]EDW72670.2 uncharacterized protein Dwil_GK17057 [Drosophila willistoni]
MESSMDSDCEGAATATLADDSGIFSYSSDDGSRIDQDKDQKMFQVRQELIKSRSEVERLIRSEQWYKQELKSQKHNRLETLERLYALERKYLQENQRLQQESKHLQAKCLTLERQQREGEEKREKICQTLSKPSEKYSESFEAQQQEARLMDQRQLIDVLRRQKKHLLEDIQRLSLEHDEKLMKLQQSLAGLEMENKHMTGKFKQLIDEKSQLEYNLELRDSTIRAVQAEREQLRHVIAELNETLQTQEQLLALKEQEYLDLKQYYQQKLLKENSLDLMHNYSLRFHEEINHKTHEIANLKNSLNELQTELGVMSDLEAQNEEQLRQLEKLEFALKTQQLEETELRKSQALKEEQIEQLNLVLTKLQVEKDFLNDTLLETREQLRNLENEIQILNKNYAELCEKCEKTKLEMTIERNENTLKEKTLHDQLQKYENKCDELSKSLSSAENQLGVWQARIQNLEQQPDLNERIECLEKQLKDMTLQKRQTISLLQSLIQQQDAKIKTTNQMETDWLQLHQTLEASHKLEQSTRDQLEQKSHELEELNELFAAQNEELHQLQQLSMQKDQQNQLELQQLRQTFQESSELHTTDALKLKELQHQVKTLLEEREKNARQDYRAADCLRSLVQIMEMETGRRIQNVKGWPHLSKLLRKELRQARMSNRKAEELPNLRLQLAELSAKHEQSLARIKELEKTLNAERIRFNASDSGKSTATAHQEPAHEVANLIDDYKKLIQQTANETGRPRNSYILELIERSKECQPSLCQLGEGIAACHSDVLMLNKLLAEREQRQMVIAPSLMDELRAVTEQS